MKIIPSQSSYKADPKITSLGNKIADPVQPANFPETILRFRNDRWAQSVGLDHLNDQKWIEHFGRFVPLDNNLQEPLAMRYHGHQFRHYNPEIGDGRGFLFAQMRDHKNRLMDLGTKGSGTTPYSRSGDGRLTLKGGVREILATEMLEALGVHTSKTFSLIETGEELERGDEPSPTRSAVMVRLNHSHIRFGTFQRIATEDNVVLMEDLVQYCLKNLYNVKPTETPAAQLFALVCDAMAQQAAQYMVAGFVHGVLNTDNMNITGESFDYGPWRFTPYWEPMFTAAYFDEHRLYAFGRQAQALHWNLAQLAVALRLICDSDPLIAALDQFPEKFKGAFITKFLWRLGLSSQGKDKDLEFVTAAEKAMIHSGVMIDEFFFVHRTGRKLLNKNEDQEYQAFADILSDYNISKNDNLYWKRDKPISMHIEEVESIWNAIAQNDDWSQLHIKIEEIRLMGNAHQ